MAFSVEHSKGGFLVWFKFISNSYLTESIEIVPKVSVKIRNLQTSLVSLDSTTNKVVNTTFGNMGYSDNKRKHLVHCT
jgi:hypothetical protein